MRLSYRANIPTYRSNNNHSEVALLLKLEKILAESKGEVSYDEDFTEAEKRILSSWEDQGFAKATKVNRAERPFQKSFLPRTTHVIQFSPQAWKYAHTIRRRDANFFEKDLESMEYGKMRTSKREGWDTDPSYGILHISRTQRRSRSVLFGSSVAHDTVITIEVSQGSVERDGSLHLTHFRPEKSLMEFHLTEAQFGAFLCAFNNGDGVPCTISYRENGPVEQKSWLPETQSLASEVRQKFAEVPVELDQVIDEAHALIKEKTISKTKLREVVQRMEMVRQQIRDNLPFSFNHFVKSIHQVKDAAIRELDAKLLWLRDKVGGDTMKSITEPTVMELEALVATDDDGKGNDNA